MLVRMKTQIGGYRDSEEWPGIGETIELPDGEADRMIAAGYAEEATGEGSVPERDEAAAEEGDSITAAEDSDEDAADESDAVDGAAPPARKRR